MKIYLENKPQIIMSNPDSYHNYFAWPTVSRLQNGKIAVVASGFRLSHVCPFGKTVISYSEDEGKTYTLPAPVVDTVLDDRDGGILAYGEKNVIVTSFNNTPEFQRFRIEQGKGFSAICPMKPYRYAYLDSVEDEDAKKAIGSNFRMSNDCGVTFGKIFKSPITSPHGPTVLNDGTVLWVGTKFVADGSADELEKYIKAYKINPDGSMDFVGEIQNIYDEDGDLIASCEPYAIGLDDGTVLCHIRAQKRGDTSITLYQSESKDGGKTWTKPYRILPENGGAPSHILRHSSGILICTFSYRKAPFGVKVMFSLDNGKTWENNDDYVYTNEFTADLGYPSTVELSDGSLLTVFYAHPQKSDISVIMQQKWRFEE